MNKKLIAVLLVLGLIVVGVVLGSQQQGGGGFLEAGYTVLNVDDVDYKENSDIWSIILSQDRGGDKLYANLRPDDGDQTQDGTELVDAESGSATKTLSINLEPQTEQCRYVVRTDPLNDRIWKYLPHYYTDFKTKNSLIWSLFLAASSKDVENDITEDCLSRGDSSYGGDYYFGIFHDRTSGYYMPICVYPKIIGYTGSTERNVIFETDFWLKIGSETSPRVSVTNSVFGSAYKNIGDYGNVRWLWNGDTGRYCPTLPEQNIAPAYLPFYYSSMSSDTLEAQESEEDSSLEFGIIPSLWATFDDDLEVLNRIENHKSVVSSDIGVNFNYIGETGFQANVFASTLQGESGQAYMFGGGKGSYSNWFNRLVTPRKPYIFNGQSANLYDTQVGGIGTAANGVINVEVTPGTFIYPQFKLEIDGQKLPIEKWYVAPQVCDPKLDVIDVSNAIKGNTGTPLTFRATNGLDGAEDCNMFAKITCGTGYSSQVPTPIGTLGPGESRLFELDFSCTTEEEITDNCKIVLEGARGESVEKSFETLCEPNPTCPPDSYYCEANYKVYCTPEGDPDVESAKYCDECVEIGDEVKCINTSREVNCDDGIDNDGDDLVDCFDPDCSDSAVCGQPPKLDDQIFAVLVGILFAVIVFAIMYSYLTKPKNRALYSLAAAGMAFIAVFLIVDAMNLPVANPFEYVTPNIKDCSCPQCWLPVDEWVCQAGNLWEALRFLFAFGVAGLGVYFLYGALSKVPEIAKKPAMIAALCFITLVVLFIIALALFWLAFIILMLYLAVRFLLPTLTPRLGI